MTRAAVIFHRLGPYHHARLAAAREVVTLEAVEVVRKDATYGWDVDTAPRPYPIATLFETEAESGSARRLVRRMAGCLERIAPDVVCIPGWSSPAALAALSWCLGRGVPAVLMADSTAHDAPRTGWKEHIKSRVVGLFSAAIVGGSPHGDYVSGLGLPRERIFPGYDVVDNAYFEARTAAMRADPEETRRQHDLPERYMLACSRFVEKKNLLRLIDSYAAYARTVHEPWSLVLVGDGPLRPALETRIAESGIAGLVRLPGFRQYDALPAYYALASLFVHASTSEQWGLVVNEAMASGLPILVSRRCGCAADLVRGGENGFTFDPLDSEGLARLMAQAAHGDRSLEAMGSASRSIIAQWSPDRFARALASACNAARMAGRLRPHAADRLLLQALCHR